MDRFRKLVHAKKRSLTRKRSFATSTSETTPTNAISSELTRSQKCAPYQHPLFAQQLKECGSFMDGFVQGVVAESQQLCQNLLEGIQPFPEHTLFSDDVLFTKTCARIQGENETKVIRDIAPLIVPSAEILADRGAEHLKILRETVNVCWVNSITFSQRSGSPPGPRPQPDFGLGFDRFAFSRGQREKLDPYLGDPLRDSSLFAATYNMYFPFFSAEIKCGATGLDIADRQNAHTQSVNLRGLHALFRLVGREKELHRKINGFSISHNDKDVKIWGHYMVIDGDQAKYYRHSIRGFDITELNGKEKWTAHNSVRNVYDQWVPKHFERICNIIDMLPDDMNFEVSQGEQQSTPGSSGLSQQVGSYDLNDEEVSPHIGSSNLSSAQQTGQSITPNTTIGTESPK